METKLIFLSLLKQRVLINSERWQAEIVIPCGIDKHIMVIVFLKFFCDYTNINNFIG